MFHSVKTERGCARLRAQRRLALPRNRVRVVLAAAAVAGALVLLTIGAQGSVSLDWMSAAATPSQRSSLALPRPSGAAAGDVLVAAVAVRASGGSSLDAPSGWTLVRRDSATGGASLTQAVYVHVTGRDEPRGYRWSFGSRTGAVGSIVAYSGVDTTAPVIASSGSYVADSNGMVAPSLTTPVAARIVGFFGNNGTRTTTPPAGMSEISDTSVGTGWGAALETADMQQGAAGATGTETALSADPSNSSSIGQLVALRPAAAPVVTPSATASTLSPASSSIVADGTSTQVLTVQAKDGNGNVLASGGASVAITRQSGTGTIGAVTDSGNGTYTATVTAPTAAGSGVFVATLNGQPVQGGAGAQTQATVTYTAPPSPPSTGGTPAPSGSQSGGTPAPSGSPGGGGGPVGTALPAAIPASTGQTFYVSPSGSDSNPGTISSPWQTVQHALDTLQPGQTALLRGGTYTPWVEMSHSGTSDAPITLAGYPGETAVLTGRLKITGQWFRVSGLTFDGQYQLDETLIWPDSSAANIEISNNTIMHAGLPGTSNHSGNGIYVSPGTSNIQILHNTIHDNGTLTAFHHGIYISGSNNLIAGNLIYGNAGYGVQCYPDCDDTLITDNTIADNGKSGVIVGSDGGTTSTGDMICDNVVADNGEYGIRTWWGSATGSATAEDNLTYGNPSGDYYGDGLTTTAGVTGDPLFADHSGHDYHTNPGSPAIDAAMAADATPTAIDGTSRPQGGGPDLGAYER